MADQNFRNNATEVQAQYNKDDISTFESKDKDMTEQLKQLTERVMELEANQLA